MSVVCMYVQYIQYKCTEKAERCAVEKEYGKKTHEIEKDNVHVQS
jgi:hypothetical protein